MSGVDLFKQEHSQVWDNIHEDPLVENDPDLKEEKENFVKHLESHTGDNLKEYALSFFKPKHRLKGPKAQLDVNEILGHLEPIERFKKKMQHTCGMTYDDAESRLTEWLRMDDQNQRLSTIKNDVGPNRLSNRMMWAFQNAHDKTDPFNNGIEPEKLPCVLGLESGSYLRFAYRLPIDVTAKVPTAFDAGIEAAWRPGGKTRPLDSCRSDHAEGLPEVVHDPSTFDDLTQPMEKL